MSGAALRERLALLDELRQIVTAMRNLAYAEVQRLNRLQAAQRQAEDAVVRALADAIGRHRPQACAPPAALLWLAIGAERGFCGGFNDQLAERLASLRAEQPQAKWFIAGARLRDRVEGVLTGAAWLAGCSGAEEGAACVDAWLSRLVGVDAAAMQRAPELWVLHHAEHGLAQRRLLPRPDLPAPSTGPSPQLNLPLPKLVPRLLAEALRVSLLGALNQSMLQENHWRLAQMQRAEDYLDDAGARLQRRYFRQRQSEITSELETLMASVDLQGGRPL